MIRIEFPKFLAWFQTPQTVSRPSRPNFQPHRTVGVSNYIQLDAIINPCLVQKRLLPCSRLPRAALDVWPHKKQLGFHPELFGSLRGWKLGLDGLGTV